MLIPLNYPSTQTEALVAQFIEGTGPSPLSGKHSPLETVADAGGTPASTIVFPHPGG
jgi:hypothetical protein